MYNLLLVFLAAVLLAETQAVVDPTCRDKLPNCDAFAETSCKTPYEAWAKENCNNTCKYCQGATKPCVDKISDCGKYPISTCSDPKFDSWAKSTCRYYCKKCQGVVYTTTTIPPALCKDKLDCKLYPKTSCSGKYTQWAKTNCMAYCGFCPGLPTSPLPCVDKRPDCASYQKSSCTNPTFTMWAQDNCRKYCGLCTGSVPFTPGVTTSPPFILFFSTTRGHGIATPPPIGFPTPPIPGK